MQCRTPKAALDGIRVIDLTTVVFGPYATQTLADYGADVIKIEAPDGGDSTRVTGPTLEPGMAPLFLGANRNKRSVVLDLKTPEGRGALDALIDGADIFIHNIRPQKLAALGLSSDRLRARNPRLIYVGLLGFGSDGAYTGQPAYDDIIQALSGVTDLNDRHVGQVRYLPTIAADKTAAQMAVHAVLAALFQRERGGSGQTVEVPMFECMVQFLLTEHFYRRHQQYGSAPRDGAAQAPLRAAPDPIDFGYPRTLESYRRPYRTADGYACIMPYSDRNWQDFFSAMGQPDLINDRRFASLGERTRNISALLELVQRETARHSTAHWLGICTELGIPSARVNRLDELEDDPHLRDVKLFGSIDSGADWTFRYVRSPIAMSDSYAAPTMPPRFGQHTAEVLAELGRAPDGTPLAPVAIAC